VVGHTSGVDSKFEEEFVATLGILEPKDLKKNCAIIIVQRILPKGTFFHVQAKLTRITR
jgi:hypothetical protein